LHDSIEDTPATARSLLAGGFDLETVRLVGLLTQGPDRDGYLRQVRADPQALAVKLADVADNTDPARTARLGASVGRRLAAKYARTLAVLAGQD